MNERRRKIFGKHKFGERFWYFLGESTINNYFVTSITARCDRIFYTPFMFMRSKIPEVTPEQVKKALDNKEHIIILDVRTPEEFVREHIAKSIPLPLSDIPFRITSVIPDKETMVYAYCFSGSRSNEAVKEMQKLGYKKVFSMRNGTLAWRLKGYPLIKN